MDDLIRENDEFGDSEAGDEKANFPPLLTAQLKALFKGRDWRQVQK